MVLRPIMVGGVPGCANIPGSGECQCWPEWTSDNAYIFGDVVQQGGVLYEARRDIPPGTPFLAADWAPYIPGATEIPPHNENSTYQQYQAVTFNDKLYTAGSLLSPGPFNPADWQEISVEGLVEVADSPTIAFGGDGSAGDPLTASVKLDPDPDNLITETANGLILTADNIPFPDPSQILISEGVTLRVDYVTGNDADADGTLAKPFATIAAAVGASDAGDMIEIYPGTYNGNFAPKSNTTVIARQDVQFTGNVTIGAAVTGVLVTDLFIDGDIILTNAGDFVEFRDVTVDNITATGNNPGVYVFDRVNVAVDVSIAGTGVGEFIFRGGIGQADFTNNSPGVMVVTDKDRTGNISHMNGYVILRDIGTILSLDSMADDTANAGLVVMSCSTFDIVTGFYGSVTKTGACRYAFQDFARENENVTPLTGPKFIVSNGRDVHGNYNPQFYTLPNGQTLNSHFNGIDNAIQALQESSPGGKLVPVDFGFSFTNGWNAGETLGAHVITRETIMPLDFNGSLFATDSSVLDATLNIMVGASVVGTVTIVDGEATFTSSQFNLDAGQVIRVVAVEEGTFDYAALTLVGHREVVYVT
ncbi:putative tail fiber protein [Agrobacterium phage OLIVR4]|nr:putative tail fiber protein [Agrobacterium phage OLIVR4]